MNYNDDNNTREDQDRTSEEEKSYATIPEDIYIERKPKNSNKKRGFKGSFLSYIIIALVASMIGGFTASYLSPVLFGKEDTTPIYDRNNANSLTINTNDDINAVTAVVQKSMQSVVGITTLETVENFFGTEDLGGVGSGFIVDSDGYILTNSHVIANGNAKEIKVLFENGDQVNGRVLWFDPALDLAIVKVDITGLPAMELGDSDQLKVGELAIAIGNPLGLDFQRTVTSGIISGLNRSIAVDQNTVLEDLIQTDASINRGNSGGPLLNSNGEVIGINTAKTQAGEGLGFAIPINSTKEIVKEVIDKGSFETVQLGIQLMDIKEYQSRVGIDLKLDKGVIILETLESSPAEKANLTSGDIILKIDDTEIDSVSSLKKSLYKYNKGDKATLTIVRNNKKETVEVSF